jgi:hypothetical protein
MDYSGLFSAGDLSDMAASAGLPIVTGADCHLIAKALELGVHDAAGIADLAVRHPANSDRQAYFRNVESSAKRLLQLLDERDDVQSLAADAPSGKRSKRGAGVNALLSETISLPPAGFPQLVMLPGLRQALARDAIFDAIESAPKAIATVMLVAEYAGLLELEGASAAGSKPDEGLDVLFTHLACTFFVTFGSKPSVGSDRYDSSQASLCWINAVLELLCTRANGMPARDGAAEPLAKAKEAVPLVKLLGAASKLAATTKADRLRAGWIAWTAKAPADKWPTGYWWPYGTDQEGMKGVPEWLLDKPISTP